MKKMKNSKNKNRVTVSVDNRIYSKESLSLASRIFSERLVIVLRQTGDSVDVTLEPLDTSGQSLEFLAGEFFNEALNQECRLILSRENANIQKMLITKAFLSTRSGSQDSQREQQSAAKKNAFEREAKKLLMQAKKEIIVHVGAGGKP